MSSGGVFQLLANDGKVDRLLIASALLKQRIDDIRCMRRARRYADESPTLPDIERTHIIPVHAHYKPFIATAFEYNKVNTATGTPALGNTVQFSIPQCGDFFNDMLVRTRVSAVSSSLRTAPTQGTGSTPGFPANGKDWDDDTTLAASFYTLVDPFGNAVTAGAANAWRNMVRWCEYPAERLFANFKFDVNSNPLCEYSYNVSTFARKFGLNKDKEVGYKRLVGQEVTLDGYGGSTRMYVDDTHRASGQQLTTTSGGIPTIPQYPSTVTATTPADFLAAAFPDAAHTLAVPSTTSAPYMSVCRREVKCVNGLQTAKYQQPATDLYMKLRFWCNNDVRLAVPAVSIPYGQRFITVDLAQKADLVFEEPGLYVRQVVDNGTARHTVYRPWVSAGTISDVTLTNTELYINNIFVSPEIHTIYINRVGFSLIRVYRENNTQTSTATSDERLMSMLKWPVEYIYVGMRPAWNVNASNPNKYRDWHRMCKVLDMIGDEHTKGEVSAAKLSGTAAAAAGATSSVGQIVPNKYIMQVPTVDTLGVKAHGVTVYDNYNTSFYNSYIPLHFGGLNIRTPDDPGAMMVNFSFYPGTYQPIGYFNVSRAREFYVQWTTSYVGTNTSAELICAANCLNFLLVSDGSASLRFST